MSYPPRLTRAEALEAAAGIALMLGAIATWRPAAAVLFAGALLFAFAVWPRRTD